MLIEDSQALHAATERFATRKWLTIDTEFVREDSYYPKLCLIQVGDGQMQACFDTLKLTDLTPLLDLLDRPGITKVFHAASQDLEIFVRLRGHAPTPLFDTQIAASLLGLGDQLGYAGLVEKRLGLKLDKSLSRTDWLRRPLTAAELAYAEDDVRHLAALYPALRAELEARGRLPWLQEDCERLAAPARYRPDPATAWERLKGLARLAPAAQHVAAALADWRERIAELRDRPRKWILADDALYRIAERQPASLEQLGDLQVLPPRTIERHGLVLLEIVETARHSAAPPLVFDLQLDAAQKSRLQRMAGRVREIAAALELPPGLLAPRADIEAVLLRGASADVPALQGWRRAVIGAALLEEAAR